MSTENAELHKEFEAYYNAIGLNIMNIPLPYVPILFREWLNLREVAGRLERLEKRVKEIAERIA